MSGAWTADNYAAKWTSSWAGKRFYRVFYELVKIGIIAYLITQLICFNCKDRDGRGTQPRVFALSNTLVFFIRCVDSESVNKQLHKNDQIQINWDDWKHHCNCICYRQSIESLGTRHESLGNLWIQSRPIHKLPETIQ